jgi:hypothetical protein
MGLLQNGFRHNATGKLFGGTNLDGANPSVHEYKGHMAARNRNQFAGNGITNKLASVPAGKRHPNVWVMPREGGSISSYNRTNMRIDGTAVAEMGFPRSGSATVTFSGSAAGGLIVGATGSSTVTYSGSASIVATLNATGTGSITYGGNAALGAIASTTGATTVTFNGHSAIMGLGSMTGTTVESGALTPIGIASAVWGSVAVDNNGAGTMGQKLNSAATGGVDYGALGDAVRIELTPELQQILKTLTVGQFLALKD